MRHGRVTQKQLDLEITLHKYLGQHSNIVEFYQSGDDQTWKWIAMELAEGGDLFDKIESDVGVGEDIAHCYFSQLISAIAYMHAKGVGHRDLKPENMLLSSNGNLKVADFGLATLFAYNGKRKVSNMSCGSPPYTAPEVLACGGPGGNSAPGYYGDLVDIWSCGVVLFVLLVGNTPWDEPVDRSYEFSEYVRTSGRPDDELWHKLPNEAVSLLRGMMKVDYTTRFSLDDVRRHPWFRRPNPHLSQDGTLANPVKLATEMFESMHIDFTQDPLASQRASEPSIDGGDAMDIDPMTQERLAATQPETPVAEIQFDWETNPQLVAVAASQPSDSNQMAIPSSLDEQLSEDLALSQFAPTPAVPLSKTQFARRFGDILPSHSLTRFVSLWNMQALLPALASALHRLGVPVAPLPAAALEGKEEAAWIKVKTLDDRRCPLAGDLVVESVQGEHGNVCQVCFVKRKGDPLQWRRFFKRVVLLCEDAVWRPE